MISKKKKNFLFLFFIIFLVLTLSISFIFINIKFGTQTNVIKNFFTAQTFNHLMGADTGINDPNNFINEETGLPLVDGGVLGNRINSMVDWIPISPTCDEIDNGDGTRTIQCYPAKYDYDSTGKLRLNKDLYNSTFDSKTNSFIILKENKEIGRFNISFLDTDNKPIDFSKAKVQPTVIPKIEITNEHLEVSWDIKGIDTKEVIIKNIEVSGSLDSAKTEGLKLDFSGLNKFMNSPELKSSSTSVTLDKIPLTTDLYLDPVVNFTSSTTWTVPSGVSSVKIEAIGGGANGTYGPCGGSGYPGGGGGSYCADNAYAVSSGQELTITVGSGNGQGGLSGVALANGTYIVGALGGFIHGTGGSCGFGNLDVNNSGGAGNISCSGCGGGGGGGAGGPTSAGNDGLKGSAGGGGAGGAGGGIPAGNGSAGGTGSGGNGTSGLVYGGGGGGGSWGGLCTAVAGGRGADGIVILTYTAASGNFTACGTISSAGSYQLTGNVDNVASSTCITITASNVNFNCNNYRIDGMDGSGTSGFYISRTSNTTTNITISNCYLSDWAYGIYNVRAWNNSFLSNTFYSNQYGILASYTMWMNVTNNNFNSQTTNDIRSNLNGKGQSNNTIYDNVFNSSVLAISTTPSIANTITFFNVTKVQPQINIIGGNITGGNYYTNSSKTGYSDTCLDLNKDGICDTPLNWTTNSNNNTDFLPLTSNDTIAPSDVRLTNPINNSYVNGIVNLTAIVSDNKRIYYTLFSWSNTTSSGTLCNRTNNNKTNDYSCQWDTATYPAMLFNITLTAVDTSGNSNTNKSQIGVDKTIPIDSNDWIDYGGDKTSVKNGTTIWIYANMTDSVGAGMKNVSLELKNLNGTNQNISMSFQSGSVLANQYSLWNVSVYISTTTLLQQARFTKCDNTNPANCAKGDSVNVQVDNFAPNSTNSTFTPNKSITGTPTHFTVTLADNFKLKNYTFYSNLSGSWSNNTAVNTSGVISNIDYNATASSAGNYSYFFIFYDDAGNYNTTSQTQVEFYSGETSYTWSVNQISPDDMSSNINNINFTYNYTGGGVATNCSLYLDDVLNITTTTPTQNATQYFNVTFIPYGWNWWYVECVENLTNNSYYSGTRYFNVGTDTIGPYGNLIIPLNNTYSTNITINFTANISDGQNLTDGGGELFIWDILGNLVYQSFIKATNAVNQWVSWLVDLSDGVFHWNVRINDTAGNVNWTNQSGNYTLTIDSTSPTINFISPTPDNNTLLIVNTTMINVSVSENVSNCILEWDPINVTIYSTAGTYSWTAPTGITSIQVQTWGGGAGSPGDAGAGTGCGGGGAGGYNITNYTVTPGNSYDVVVGAGGTSTVCPTTGNSGTASSFDTKVNSGGGAGGVCPATGAGGGAGGTGLYAGGSGGTGGVVAGGGGGSSAGNISAGNNGDTAPSCNGGTAVTGGGAGGNGWGCTTANGVSPGGGAGGGGSPGNSGKNGADGQVIIVYTEGAGAKGITNYTMTSINKGASTTAYYNVTGLTAETNYTYWVWCNDSLGNYATGENRSNNYTALSIPSFTGIPNNVTINAGESFNVTFNASGGYFTPITFSTNDSRFLINNSGYMSNGTIPYGVSIVVNVSIYNSISNVNSVLWKLTVNADTTKPYFTTIPANMTINYGINVSVLFNATDNIGLLGYYVNDTHFSINSTGGLNNITGLQAKTWYLNVSINDTSNNINSTLWKLIINQLTNTPYMLLNGGTSNLVLTYPQQVNASANCTDGSVNLTRSGIDRNSENHLNVTLGVNNYTYEALCIDTGNYSLVALDRYVNITKENGLIRAYINNTEDHFNSTESGGKDIWLNGTLITGEGNIKIYLNGSLINEGASPLSNLTNLTIGDYNFTAIYEGNQNYTSDSEYWFINITADACVENLTNSSWGDWTNETGICLATNNMTNIRNLTQYDSNTCGYVNVTIYEYQNETCNYCSYNITNTTFTDWENETCILDERNQTRFKFEYDSNYSTCYLVTNLSSDLWNSGVNITYNESQLATNNITNTTWGDYSAGACVVNDRNDSRNLTQYDSNNFGCYANVTIFEYQLNLSNLTYTAWSSFENESCIGSNMNQTQNRTQYDSVGLGCFVNLTEYNSTLIGPTLANTSFGAWTNVTTCVGNITTYNQTRNATQYDIYSCASNSTVYEYQNLSCTDTTKPTWVNLRNFTTYVNNSFSQSITATDDFGIHDYALNDTSIFIINPATGLITNNSALDTITIYWLNITVNDTSENMAEGMFYINVTLMPPTFNLTIVSPQNTSYDSSSVNVTVWVNSSNPIGNYSYSLDGGNTTIFIPNITLMGLSWEAYHTINISVNDSTGDMRSELRIFYVGDKLITQNYWLYIFLCIAIVILLIIGYMREDLIINILAGMLVIALGFAFYKYSYSGIDSDLVKNTIFYVILSVGGYIMLINALHLVQEND